MLVFSFIGHILTELGRDYVISACRDEISTYPAETDFTLWLYVEIKFRAVNRPDSFPPGI